MQGFPLLNGYIEIILKLTRCISVRVYIHFLLAITGNVSFSLPCIGSCFHLYLYI